MEKILIVGPSWLGDMVMAQSLFRLLHQRGATIDVLAPEWNFAVLERMPEVRRGVVMPIDHGEFNLAKRHEIGKELREEKYDHAYVLPNSFKSALVPYFANIPKRTGWMRELRYGLLNDWRNLDKKKYPLMVQRFVALGYGKDEQWDKNSYPLPKLIVEESSVQEKLTRHQLAISEGQKILALSPGAAFGETKRWPAEYYAQIANEKLDQGWQVWLFGSAKDAEMTAKVQAQTNARCRDLAGQLKLDETVDLISKADLVISNDSGLLHVTAALDRPLVAIYGSTSPAFTPPLGDKVRVLDTEIECRPCFKRECKFGHLKCLTQILPAQVSKAMTELLV